MIELETRKETYVLECIAANDETQGPSRGGVCFGVLYSCFILDGVFIMDEMPTTFGNVYPYLHASGKAETRVCSWEY